MNSVAFLSLIITIFPLSLAAVAQGFFNDSKYPGKCVTDGMILSAGEEMTTPGKCEHIVCHEKSYGTLFTCGVVGVPPGYVLGDPIHPDAEYPKCCARKIVLETTTQNTQS